MRDRKVAQLTTREDLLTYLRATPTTSNLIKNAQNEVILKQTVRIKRCKFNPRNIYNTVKVIKSKLDPGKIEYTN